MVNYSWKYIEAAKNHKNCFEEYNVTNIAFKW